MYGFSDASFISVDGLHFADYYDRKYLAGGCGAQHTLETFAQKHIKRYQLQ